MTDSYKDYFKEHFHIKYVADEMYSHANFLSTQFSYISSLLGLENFSRKGVLEVGSGLGSFAHLLFRAGVEEYTGIEMDPDAVDFSNDILGKHFINTSIESYDPKKSQVDLVFALEVLEHLGDPILALEKMYDFLKKDGYFVATTPFPFQKNITSDPTHLFVLHPDTWKKILTEAGFREVRTYPMSFVPYVWRLVPRLNVILPFYVSFKGLVSTTLILAKK